MFKTHMTRRTTQKLDKIMNRNEQEALFKKQPEWSPGFNFGDYEAFTSGLSIIKDPIPAIQKLSDQNLGSESKNIAELVLSCE